jgi:hypothetical protein
MSIATTPRGYVERPRPSGLADVVDVILDKGLVIDAYVRVALIGIEILTIDARIVIASVDTYLRFAEAVNRLDIREDESQGLPELIEHMTEGGAASKTKGALEGAKEKLLGGDSDQEKQESGSRRRSSSDSGQQKQRSGSRRRSSSSGSSSRSSSGSSSRSSSSRSRSSGSRSRKRSS